MCKLFTIPLKLGLALRPRTTRADKGTSGQRDIKKVQVKSKWTLKVSCPFLSVRPGVEMGEGPSQRERESWRGERERERSIEREEFEPSAQF